MSFLSSAVSKRRLVLLCARLLVQCVMTWSIPHAGTDEPELRCVEAVDDTSPQSIARDEQTLLAQRAPA
jgi:hypothetical protein